MTNPSNQYTTTQTDVITTTQFKTNSITANKCNDANLDGSFRLSGGMLAPPPALPPNVLSPSPLSINTPVRQ